MLVKKAGCNFVETDPNTKAFPMMEEISLPLRYGSVKILKMPHIIAFVGRNMQATPIARKQNFKLECH